ncbi:hypothetical protein ASD99_12275 [Mesorhizobium sp. Root695]|jgi:hypothetical protein|nr:hypothetical protein ASD12_01330 [Mesorhizobium sp. Root102]KRB14991.1 hypothetical protein ASD99_12275 [Mesorhizobium sp. Root695]
MRLTIPCAICTFVIAAFPALPRKGSIWWGWLLQLVDWTDGCIAVTDSDMDEIWAMVADGTPIEIER